MADDIKQDEVKACGVNKFEENKKDDGYGGGSTGIIARLDAKGDTVWVRRLYRMWHGIEVRALCPTADGGVLAAGSLLDEPPFLLRLSAQGDSLWTRVCDDSTIYSIQAICPTADGWYLAGYTREYQACIMRVSEQGGRIWFWQRTSDSLHSDLRSVTLAPDGGAIACGHGGLSFVRLSPEGESLCTRIIRSPSQWCERIIPYGDGYVTVGSAHDSHGSCVQLNRLSPGGDVVESKLYGASEDNYGHDVIVGNGDWLYAIGCTWPSKQFEIIHTRF
jgi:hypothetical protein